MSSQASISPTLWLSKSYVNCSSKLMLLIPRDTFYLSRAYWKLLLCTTRLIVAKGIETENYILCALVMCICLPVTWLFCGDCRFIMLLDYAGAWFIYWRRGADFMQKLIWYAASGLVLLMSSEVDSHSLWAVIVLCDRIHNHRTLLLNCFWIINRKLYFRFMNI